MGITNVPLRETTKHEEYRVRVSVCVCVWGGGGGETNFDCEGPKAECEGRGVLGGGWGVFF